MLTTRYPWGATTVLLCALLLQNCQSQLNALEEESSAAAPPQSGWQPPASEALTQPLGYPPSPTTATHQPKVPPAAFAGSSPSAGLHPAASITRLRNIFTQDSYRPLTASTGELVRFQQVGSQWQAVVQGKDRSYTRQRTLPVVSVEDIGTQLTGLQGQDVCASRSRIHIMAVPHPPYSPCVYLGKSGLLGGMPTQQAPLAAAARANAARDVAVAKANEAVVRANAERNAAVARANTARDAAAARENAALASKQLQTLLIPSMAFGRDAWRQYFGVEVDDEPLLPGDIEEILNGEAPFLLEDEERRHRVRDNHLLVLIPAEVDALPFTLDKLGELILPHFPHNHREGLEDFSHGYHYYSEYLNDNNRREALSSKAYWVLLSKTILADSRDKSYPDQQNMVAHYSASGYRLPHALEVATSLLAHYVRSKERLYVTDNSNSDWTYTRCVDTNEDGDPFIVGRFEPAGLLVSSSYDYVSLSSDGVACCRKF